MDFLRAAFWGSDDLLGLDILCRSNVELRRVSPLLRMLLKTSNDNNWDYSMDYFQRGFARLQSRYLFTLIVKEADRNSRLLVQRLVLERKRCLGVCASPLDCH